MSAPPSTSSSSFSYIFTYDVFLSFRGIDTRHGFTGNLYKALRNKGIRTFFDDEELRKGEEITPALVKAIEESRIAIPVFSKNYASSSFCLAELVKIMEYVKGKGRLVLPVFYDVDPSDVRHQRGSYGEALTKQEERFKDDKEKVQKWREALRQAANLSSEDFKLGNEDEYVFIEKIVKEVSNKISHNPLHVADYPVGLESRVLEVNSLLNDRSGGGAHMVGLYGIGGIVDEALLDHPENCRVESSHAPSFAGLASRETKNIGLMLDLNKEPTDTFYHAPPKTGLVSDSIMSRLTSDTARERDRAVLDHPENCPVESSLAPSFAEMQNIQMPCPTSLSGTISGEELHPETCWTISPTTIDESLRNQVEQSQDEVEMESSLDAGTHVLSHSHDHSATTAPSEEAIDALEKVHDINTNVPFTSPNSLRNTNDFDLRNHFTLLDNGLDDQVPDMNQQQLPLLNPRTPTSCEPVEYTEDDWHSAPPSLDDVYCSSDSDSVPQSLVASPLEQPLHDAYNYSDSTQSARAINGTNGLPKKCIVLFLSLFLIVASLFWSIMWHWCFHHSYTLTGTKLDHAILDHPEKAPKESPRATGFGKMQNTEAQSPTLSSGKISGQEELHLNTMLPTTIDESVRNQLEPSQDDVEMEAFYATLDADTYVPSRSHDHSAMTATSEEVKEALKIVQDFITNDPSFLLDPEQCSIMKTSLDYLSNLYASDDALSGEMRALLSEASRVFTHYSKDYIEASMKIESTASELLKGDKLEADLEGNKNQFKEVMALEKELLQELAYLEESKKELEKQINAVKANISASQSAQSMTRKKKRDIFEEGKALKTQMSEFREKVPHLQHEQDLAKETQAKIRAEWSELREKFKKIVVE